MRSQRSPWRAATVLLVTLLGCWVLAGVAVAVTVPTDPPSPPPTELPIDPLPSPSPSPTTQPSPAPTQQPTQQPDPGTSPTPGTTASPAPTSASPLPSPSPVPAGGSTGGTVLPDAPAPAPGVDQPQVAPPGGGPTGGSTGATRTLLVAAPDALSGALGGAFVLAFAAILGGIASSFTTFTMTNRGALVAHTRTGEIDMERTRRMRTVLGVALLAVAGLIGIVGYLRISVETLVPVQVVYLASAGFGVVVFGIAGGSLLVAETLRSDEHRVRELESAVATLAAHLAGQVQDPPRLVDRSATPSGDEGGVDAVDPTDVDDTADGGASAEADPGATTRIRTVRRVRRPGDDEMVTDD